jgi:hypothetical protein
LDGKNLGPGLGVSLEPSVEEDFSKTLDYPLGMNGAGSNLCAGAIDGDGIDLAIDVSSLDAENGGRVVKSIKEDCFLSFGCGRAALRRC